MTASIEVIDPTCFSLPDIRAHFTTRVGGYSELRWKSFNLATHVGDDPDAVRQNRALLKKTLHLPQEPCWLDQVHGKHVLQLDGNPTELKADASTSTTPGQVCAVLVADCVPLLLCDRAGGQVAAVHAGWRGLDAGVIAAAIDAFSADPAHLIAWIGPTINAGAYQVGVELRQRFVSADAGTAGTFSTRGSGWYMDLVGLACHQLERNGVRAITVSEHCVHRQRDLFYSYRRDGSTGRMAALIWIEPR